MNPSTSASPPQAAPRDGRQGVSAHPSFAAQHAQRGASQTSNPSQSSATSYPNVPMYRSQNPTKPVAQNQAHQASQANPPVQAHGPTGTGGFPAQVGQAQGPRSFRAQDPSQPSDQPPRPQVAQPQGHGGFATAQQNQARPNTSFPRAAAPLAGSASQPGAFASSTGGFTQAQRGPAATATHINNGGFGSSHRAKVPQAQDHIDMTQESLDPRPPRYQGRFQSEGQARPSTSQTRQPQQQDQNAYVDHAQAASNIRGFPSQSGSVPPPPQAEYRSMQDQPPTMQYSPVAYTQDHAPRPYQDPFNEDAFHAQGDLSNMTSYTHLPSRSGASGMASTKMRDVITHSDLSPSSDPAANQQHDGFMEESLNEDVMETGRYHDYFPGQHDSLTARSENPYRDGRQGLTQGARQTKVFEISPMLSSSNNLLAQIDVATIQHDCSAGAAKLGVMTWQRAKEIEQRHSEANASIYQAFGKYQKSFDYLNKIKDDALEEKKTMTGHYDRRRDELQDQISVLLDQSKKMKIGKKRARSGYVKG